MTDTKRYELPAGDRPDRFMWAILFSLTLIGGACGVWGMASARQYAGEIQRQATEQEQADD